MLLPALYLTGFLSGVTLAETVGATNAAKFATFDATFGTFGTKSVGVQPWPALRPLVLQGASGQHFYDEPHVIPAVSPGKAQEANVVQHQGVPSVVRPQVVGPQEAYFGSYISPVSPVTPGRRYVQYVPYVSQAQPQVYEVEGLLIRSPSGQLLIRPVNVAQQQRPVYNPLVQYVLLQPAVSQEKPLMQTAPQAQVLKGEVSAPVDESSVTPSTPLVLASVSSTTSTEPQHDTVRKGSQVEEKQEEPVHEF